MIVSKSVDSDTDRVVGWLSNDRLPDQEAKKGEKEDGRFHWDDKFVFADKIREKNRFRLRKPADSTNK